MTQSWDEICSFFVVDHDLPRIVAVLVSRCHQGSYPPHESRTAPASTADATTPNENTPAGQLCTMPKRQAVVIFPEVNYEL
jgi:hypothetical protein